jgi:hypothetical protein
MDPEVRAVRAQLSAATASSIDCSRASDADRVCDCGEGFQWPKERKPMFFTFQRTLGGAAGFPGNNGP